LDVEMIDFIKAERAFLDAGGAKGESARRWPSVLTPSVLTEDGAAVAANPISSAGSAAKRN
jgi:hypothetical protein